MKNIVTAIDLYLPLILAATAILIVILFIMVIVLFSSLSKLEHRYKKLSRGVDNKNIEEIINGYMDKIEEIEREGKEIKGLYDGMDNRIKGCLQKVSVVRYRAFEDVGSDLSFSVAALDDKNNGLILTGLFGRHESTTYAKPVDGGISRYELSSEEKQALKEAMDKK
ncbi:MAG TPA: DUF4446 family protein [Clostridiaceae bacterium]|nr:DUF4446 family protein [Clostridiaceae bacterium]